MPSIGYPGVASLSRPSLWPRERPLFVGVRRDELPTLARVFGRLVASGTALGATPVATMKVVPGTPRPNIL